MDPNAPQLISGLLEDDGASILRAAGQGATWDEVLAGVPPAVLELPEGTRARGASMLVRLRDWWSRTGQVGAAAAATRGLYELKVKRLGVEHPDTLVELSMLGVFAVRGGVADGRRMVESAWSKLRSIAGGRDLRLAIASANLGDLALKENDLVRAEQLYATAWRIRTEINRKTTGIVAGRLAEVRIRMGQVKEALPLLFEAWQRHRELLGPSDPRTLVRARLLSRVLMRVGRYESAATVLRELLNQDRLGGNAELIAESACDLGTSLHEIGRTEEGYRLVEESVRWTRAQGGPHVELPNRLTNFAKVMMSRGHREESEGLIREALEAERRLYGDDSIEVARRYASLGRICLRSRRTHEGLGWLEASASLCRARVGENDALTILVVEELGTALVNEMDVALQHRDHELAQDLMARLGAYAGSVLDFDHPILVRARRIQE